MSIFTLPRNQTTLTVWKRIILAVFHLAKDGLSLITLRGYCPDPCRMVVRFWTAHCVVHFSCLFSHLPFCKNKLYFVRGVHFSPPNPIGHRVEITTIPIAILAKVPNFPNFSPTNNVRWWV